MALNIPPCQAAKSAGCRLLAVQQRVMNSMQRVATRVTRMNINMLKNPGSGVIKGLWLTSKDCSYNRGLIIFGRPAISMGRMDYQHKDLAVSIGLRLERDREAFSDSGYQAGITTLAEKDVWGFALIPVRFRSGNSLQSYLSSDGMANNYELIVPKSTTQLICSEDKVRLNEAGIEDIGQRTAVKFWRQRIYGFMYSNIEDIGTVWVVKTAAGLTGVMPYFHVLQFMNDLARYVSPHFAVFRFMPTDRQKLVKERIAVSDEDVAYPSCLRWPAEFMLVNQLTEQAGNLDKPET